MQWFDWMTLAIILAIAILQAIRANKVGGMGLPLFETANLLKQVGVNTGLDV